MARLHLSQINPSGSLNLTGSFSVAGQTTFYQTQESQSAVVVSGALDIVEAQIGAQVEKAKITIQGLGSLADRVTSSEIDLGGFF